MTETKMKLTREQAVRMELYSVGEAICEAMELNDSFINSYCDEDIAIQLKRIDCIEDRAFALDGNLGEGMEAGCITNRPCIVIPMEEIEVQLGDDVELEDPSDWTIIDGFAYTVVDNFVYDVDIAGLREAIDDLVAREKGE